ncbi:MAG TPA: hypothetical protein VF669_06865 [Tepidisphaeraceae bacterium]|jgi:hypothetical protein
MPSSLRLVGRFVLLVILTANAAPAPQHNAINPTPDSAEASLPPQVRLRKLHLVRPDLIPYPIAYEVCC